MPFLARVVRQAQEWSAPEAIDCPDLEFPVAILADLLGTRPARGLSFWRVDLPSGEQVERLVAAIAAQRDKTDFRIH
jgi:hypothetical protein